MTICNMSIEGGARAGMIAPDETTFEYLAGRAVRAQGRRRGMRPLSDWRTLPTDEGATYDAERRRSTPTTLEPMITYGTNPGMGMPITGRVPDPAQLSDRQPERAALDKALRYMDLQPGAAAAGHSRSMWSSSAAAPIRASPICALAASLMKGRKVADGVRDDGRARLAAGQDAGRSRRAGSRSSSAAGAEWREAGCSMCIAMNGDQLAAGAVRRQHQQPQFRRPAGQGRAHLPGQPAHRRGHGRQRRGHRPARAVIERSG